MKDKFFSIIFFIFCISISAQEITGKWKGNLKMGENELPITVSIKEEAGKYSSTFESPEQSDEVFSAENTSFENDLLLIMNSKLGIMISGKLENGELKTVFKQNNLEIPVIFNKDNNITPEKPKRIISDLKDIPGNTKKMDEYLNLLTSNHQAVGSVSIFRNGKEVYVKNFGQNQLENAKYNANTEYHIGSVTKTFTATMIFQMIEKGNLKLTDKLSKFYPKIPNADKITIKDLLNHTSGLGDYVGEPTEGNDFINKPETTEKILDEITKQGVTFQPGEQTRYSNSGYFLLSRILEKISGENYNEILNRNIIQKLQLKNTHSLVDYNKNIFQSYEPNGEKWNSIKELEFQNAIGLGDITSTTTDLNIFINALFAGKLVSNESLKQMTTLEKNSAFGMGLMRVPFYNQTSFGHGGTTMGTHSSLSYDEKNNYSIALITNANRMSTNDIDIGISSILFDLKDFEFPTFYKANENELSQYEGTYSKADFPLKITITKSGNDLKAQGTGQSSFIITPIGKDKFGMKQVDFTIEFSTENKTATIIQHGEKFILTKE